jgi:hypothetical protein
MFRASPSLLLVLQQGGYDGCQLVQETTAVGESVHRLTAVGALRTHGQTATHAVQAVKLGTMRTQSGVGCPAVADLAGE